MISKDRLGAFGVVMLAAACASPTPKPNLDSFTYRATFQKPDRSNVSLYSEAVRYPTDSDGTTDIVMVDVFCPDERACNDFLDKNRVTGKNVSLGAVDPMSYRQLEFVNQESTYVSCGNPVPSPFTVGKACS